MTYKYYNLHKIDFNYIYYNNNSFFKMLAYPKILANAHKSIGSSYFMYFRIITPAAAYQTDKNVMFIKDKLNMRQLALDGTIPIDNIIYNSKAIYTNDEANIQCKRTGAYVDEVKPYVTMYYYNGNITISNGEELETYTVECVFYEIPVMYQIPSILMGSTAMANILIRHMHIYNDYLQSDNGSYMKRLDEFNTAISNNVLYDLSSHFKRCDPASIGMRTDVLGYQINNLNYMIDREENPLYEAFSNSKLLVFDNGLIFNYNKNTFIKLEDIPLTRIKGGVIADDPGIGKTLQMLTLCWIRRMPTAIVVPDHLAASNHWEMEMCKHFINPDEFNTFVTVFSFTQFSELEITAINFYKRIIIDEAHETYTTNSEDTDIIKKMKYKLFSKLTATNCDHKWLVTGTPFASGTDAPFKIISLLTDDKRADAPIRFTYETFSRNRLYDPTLELLFRRNIKENINDELHLPNSNIINVVMALSQFEKELYDTEILANTNGDQIDPTKHISKNIDVELLRKICSNVMTGCSGDDISIQVSVSQIKGMFLDKFRDMYESQFEILTSYNDTIANLYAVRDEIARAVQQGNTANIPEIMRSMRVRNHDRPSYDMMSIDGLQNTQLMEINHNIKHYEELIASQSKIVESRQAVFKRYEKIMEVIESVAKKSKTEEEDADASAAAESMDYEKTCPICADTLNTVMALYDCGHLYCKSCSDMWRKSSNTCVTCRAKTPDDKITIVRNDNDNPYGTKVKYILDLLKSSDDSEQYVIFTQFEKSIRVLMSILEKEGIKASVYHDWSSIVNFKKDNKKVIILSSAQQPSGLDLSFISNIIMMEPLHGEYSFRRDIEKQIIGRIHRIKQSRNINVYRLIIKNTIEEQLYVDL